MRRLHIAPLSGATIETAAPFDARNRERRAGGCARRSRDARPAQGRRGARRSPRAARGRDRIRAAPASAVRTTAGTDRRRRRARPRGRPAPRRARWRSACGRPRGVVRPRSFIASIGAPRAARIAGATPKTSAAMIATADVNASMRQSSGSSRYTASVASCDDEELAAPLRDDHSGGRAHGGEQQAFDQELARQTSARRAEREAHAPFVAARGGAREQQIGDVGARDQQHESPTTTRITSSGRRVVFAESGRWTAAASTNVNGSVRYSIHRVARARRRQRRLANARLQRLHRIAAASRATARASGAPSPEATTTSAGPDATRCAANERFDAERHHDIERPSDGQARRIRAASRP